MNINLNVTGPSQAQVHESARTQAQPAANAAAQKGPQVLLPFDSEQPSVIFRRDAAGQIYYVLTDPQTGRELREVPAEAVRKVGEGIAQYLKQEAKRTNPLETQA